MKNSTAALGPMDQWCCSKNSRMMVGELGRRAWSASLVGELGKISPAAVAGMNAVRSADAVAELVAQRRRERLAGITTQSGQLIAPPKVRTSLK